MTAAPPARPAKLDHLVYTTPDVAASVAELEERTGVPVTPGGSHVGKGTRNAFLAIGPRMYIEVLGPDEFDTAFTGSRRYNLDGLTEPTLLTWCTEPQDLQDQAAVARAHGYEPGETLPLSRRKPDGELLEWTLVTHTFGDLANAFGGVVPFMIDWLDCTHPTAELEQKVTLREFTATHPDAEGTRNALAAMGADLPVNPGERPSLTAVFDTPNGQVTLT